MAVTSANGGTASSIGNGTGADSGKVTNDKAIKNGHDKENNSANCTIVRPGNDGDVLVSTNTIEIGENINVSELCITGFLNAMINTARESIW
jgi:hypothetical protein